MFYALLRLMVRFIFFCTQRRRVTGLEYLPKTGPYLIASNHEGHVDPYCISTQVESVIHWMARTEFFRARWLARFMQLSLAFPVDRTASPLPAIRHALRLLRRGEVIGIFPEGEVMRGNHSVLNGGRIKRGVCLLSRHSGCPIIPCAIRGTAKLHRIEPWLPARRGQFEIHFGPPLYTGDDSGTPRQRDETMRLKLEGALRALDTCFSPALHNE